MKRSVISLCLVLILALTFCFNASAVTVMGEDGAPEVGFLITDPDAVSGKYYLLVITDRKVSTPEADDIVYIDQQTAGSSGVSFFAPPSAIAAGEYFVYISTNADSRGLQLVGSAEYPGFDSVNITFNPGRTYTSVDLRVTTENGDKVNVSGSSAGGYTFMLPDESVIISAAFSRVKTEKKSFEDVKEGAYYYDAVMWAVEEGVTSGVDATHFAPDGAATREQMVTFMWRAMGSPEPEAKTCRFTDVEKGSYYEKAVLWAVENGITSGTSATTFSPKTAVSRAQAVTFIAQLMKYTRSSEYYPNNFTDVPTGSWYEKPVAWAAGKGITSGTTATTFSPNALCSRAQIVCFLQRALG